MTCDNFNQSGRTLSTTSIHRGERYEFSVPFFEDDGRTIPLIPVNEEYPKFVIYGPGNQYMTSGVGLRGSEAGYWTTGWTVPADAPLTSDGVEKARIDWVMVAGGSREITETEYFDIQPTVATVTEEGGEFYSGVPGRSNRIIYRSDSQLDSVCLEIYNVQDSENPVVEEVCYPDGLSVVQDGETWVYYYDTPTDMDPGTYQIFWYTRATPGSPEQNDYQQLEIVHRACLQYMASLRLYMDKVGKSLAVPRGITDSELIEYIKQGLRIINVWHPNTVTWDCASFPHALLGQYLVVAASIHGYSVAFGVESDLSFDFSGQTTTLNYDHTGHIESSISRATSWLEANLTNSKVAIIRRAAGTGVVAGRPLRYRQRQRVFKVGQFGAPNDYINTLIRFGLLSS